MSVSWNKSATEMLNREVDFSHAWAPAGLRGKGSSVERRALSARSPLTVCCRAPRAGPRPASRSTQPTRAPLSAWGLSELTGHPCPPPLSQGAPVPRAGASVVSTAPPGCQGDANTTVL